MDLAVPPNVLHDMLEVQHKAAQVKLAALHGPCSAAGLGAAQDAAAGPAATAAALEPQPSMVARMEDEQVGEAGRAHSRAHPRMHASKAWATDPGVWWRSAMPEHRASRSWRARAIVIELTAPARWT